jgi:hypothetical protein
MVRSLCELEWGEKEKGGDGVQSARRRASNGAPKEKKEGVPVRGRGRESRADKHARERGAYSARAR